MTIFPNAKINIGLNIISKRRDGYHNIESVFYPVGAKDILEFVVHSGGNDSDELTISGLSANCNMKDNLVIKALNLLRKDYTIPPLKIHLHKAIPAGSGLGGGSSDAAFMLRYLNRYFNLGLDTEALSQLALSLGSDCAFFISNSTKMVRGRGEVLEDINLNLKDKYIKLIHPGIHISTAEAYGMVKPGKADYNLAENIIRPISEWKDRITNDFQEPIIKKKPLIGKLIDKLYSEGAFYSSMTGSGSAVYGIFDSMPGTVNETEYWSWTGQL